MNHAPEFGNTRSATAARRPHPESCPLFVSRTPAHPPDSDFYAAPPTLMAVLLLPLTTAVR